MIFFSWLSGVVIALLIIGFLIGFWRNWHKSLARFLILLAVLLISLFSAPAITKYIIDNFAHGSVLSIFGISIDFEALISQLVGAEIAKDLAVAEGTTNALILSFMNVAVNLALFIAMFVILSLFTLIIYWIVCLILHTKSKNNEKEIRHGTAWWGLRSLGGVFGLVSTMLILFAMLSPVFGVMNICNKFIEEEKSAKAYSYELAEAVGAQNFVGRKLYYTEDGKIGIVEGYLKTYADLKNAYDDSAAGKLFNAFGISNLGAKSFDYLSSVSHGKLSLNLTDEFISIAKAYNDYKEIFVENTFDITNNKSVDGLMEIFEDATSSQIISRYLEDLLPTLCEKWAKDEKFLGITLPLDGDNAIYAPVAKSMLSVFVMGDIDRISENVNVLFNAIKIANDNKFIEEIRQENYDLLEYLQNDQSFIKNEILNLASTSEFRKNLPDLFNGLFEILYKITLEQEISFENNSLFEEQIANINWENEAVQIQMLINNLAKIASAVSGNEEEGSSNSDAILSSLTNLGVALDCGRASQLLNKPIKTFVSGMIASDKFAVSENVKSSISSAITENWEKEDCSFETLFEAIEKAVQIASNMADGNVDLTVLENNISEILSSSSLKEAIKNIISNNVIEEFVQDESAGIITEILTGFVDSEHNLDNISNELKATQIFIDIAKANSQQSGNFLNGETLEEKQLAANELVDTINNSVIAIEILEKANSSDPSFEGIKNTINNLSNLDNTDDLLLLQDAINNLDDNVENKALLQSLFCR